jgi:RHS repeat-associated protein
LTATYSALGVTTFAYDQRGNVTERHVETTLPVTQWPQGTYVSTAAYDELNRPVGGSLPMDSASMASYVATGLRYDERGLPRELSLTEAGRTRVALAINRYSATAKPLEVRHGNGLVETWLFHPTTERLEANILQTPSSQVLQRYDYAEYDANDNPLKITRVAGDLSVSKIYRYDSLNRLESATYSGFPTGPTSYEYRYSKAGNLSLKDGYTYHYDSPDPQAVTSRDKDGAVESFTYDVDGNMLTAARGGATTTYTWDTAGRLRTSSRTGEGTATYLYGAEGERVVKSQSCAGAASTCRAADDIYIGPLELRGSEQAADGGLAGYYNLSLGPVVAQLALRRDVNGLLVRDPEADRSYHLDHLGSTALVTAPDGRPENPFGSAGRLDYGPYGESRFTDTSASRIRRQYTGKELDPSGLQYFGARYYDASLGRWISRDPKYVYLASRTASTGSLYAFVAANPVRLFDPNGLQEQDKSKNQKEQSTSDGSFGAPARQRDQVFEKIAKKQQAPDQAWNTMAKAWFAAFASAAVLTALPSGVTGGAIAIELVTALELRVATTPVVGGLATAVRNCTADISAPGSTTMARPAAGSVEGAASRVLLRNPQELQAKFKHAADFGVAGNHSKANAAEFSRAIHQHINSPGVRAIQGTYHKQPVTHYLDPSTGLNVMADPAGNFISGWRLSPAQLQNVLRTRSEIN